jgi:hypothetical protein
MTRVLVKIATLLALSSAQICLACTPPSGLPKPWSEVIADRFESADYVLIGTVSEVRKIPWPVGPTRARDRAHVNVAEMLKGAAESFRFIETDNIDGLPSGCGFRIKANTRYLFMQAAHGLTMAIPLDEPSYGIDIEFTVNKVRQLSATKP